MLQDGKRHIWKWWDDAVMEELDIVRVEIQDAQEKYQVLLRRIGAGQTAVNDPSGTIFSGEIEEMRAVLDATNRDIANLKEQLGKKGWGYGYEISFALLAGMVISSVVLYMFKWKHVHVCNG